MKKIDNIIIVLGHINEEEHLLSYTARLRAQAAFELSEKLVGENSKFLLTGGANEFTRCKNQPHAFYIQQQLCALGISEDQILPEHAESKHTLEDAQKAKPIIAKYSGEGTRLYIVTSKFHSARAALTFRKVFGDEYPIISHAADNGLGSEEANRLNKTEASKIIEYNPEQKWIAMITQKEMASLGAASSKLWQR